MIKIAVGDGFLARSEAFKLLLDKFRDHKLNTKDAFAKVRKKHDKYDDRLGDLEIRVNELQTILNALSENDPIKIKKKVKLK